MKNCNKCQSDNTMMVEYGWEHPQHYDGISEYRCMDCKYREGRWSGKELKDGEWELKYGGN